MLQISQLLVYPIKSLGGIALESAVVTDRGLEHDRRWMLIDGNGRFLSQREFAFLALFRIELTTDGLLVKFSPKSISIIIPYQPLKKEMVQVTIWDDICTGQLVSDSVDQWFSEVLEFSCRLVYMPDETERIVDPRYAMGKVTSFADAYPFLLIGQASLDELNTHLAEPLPMDRFRPNIVFTGGEPFAEDSMHSFTVNDITFNGVKLCARCIMTTINQETAGKGKEPLKTLAKYRFKKNKILFGQNLIHNGTGVLNVGDVFNVLQLHNHERFLLA